MSAPTLRALLNQAEQVISDHGSRWSWTQYVAAHTRLVGEMVDPQTAADRYEDILRLDTPDPSTLPPPKPTYREPTPTEVHFSMTTGVDLGIDPEIDAAIDAFLRAGELPRSVAGLEAIEILVESGISQWR